MRRWLLVLVVTLGCSQRSCRATSTPDAGPDLPWLEGTVAPETTQPRDGGVLTIRLPLEPQGLTRLHDRFAEGTMVRITVGPLYETLVHAAEGGQFTPSLAEKWVDSDDHLQLEVTLRDGVHFHDGTVLSAKDLEATLRVVRDTTLATSAFRSELEAIAAVEVTGPRSVKITWSHPSVLARRTLLAALPVMPAHALEGDFDTLSIHRAPIGTGPFRFEKWDPGGSLTYVRADDRAHVQQVVFRFIKDDAVALQALEKGEVDLMTRVPSVMWRDVERAPWAWSRTRRLTFLENSYVWMGFNQRLPRFADPRVRRALSLLYPSELVAKVVDLGLEPRTNCPFDPRTTSCDRSVPLDAFDPVEAGRVLDAAGWKDSDGDGIRDRDGTKLTVKFLMAAQSLRMSKVLPLYLEPLKAAGIDASVESVDASAYLTRVRAHDFEGMALSWSAPDDAQDLYNAFHSSQRDHGLNYVGYENHEVDSALEKLRNEVDPTVRSFLEREVHRRVADDHAYLFMSRIPRLDLAQRRVHGLKPSLAWYDLASVWLED